MRASPAFQVTLRRFGAWQAAVRAISMLAAAVIVAWVVLQPASPSLWVLILAGSAVAAVLGLGASLAKAAPASLRWDGQCWHLGPAESIGNEPFPGALAVTIDLGGWVLLRFAPDADASVPGAVWLPAQKAGLTDAQWHALRCAVHAPRPPRADLPPAL